MCAICDVDGPCHHAQQHPEVVFGHHHHEPHGFSNAAFVQDNGLAASTSSLHQTAASGVQVLPTAALNYWEILM